MTFDFHPEAETEFLATMIKDEHTGSFIFTGHQLLYRADEYVEVWAAS